MKFSFSPQFYIYGILAFVACVVTWDVSSVMLFPAPKDAYNTVRFGYDTASRRLATDDGYEYVNPNDTYSPNQYVKYGHKLTGQEFSTDMSYLERALYTPIIIFALGLVALILFNLGLLCRCCFQSCRCMPSQENESAFKRNALILRIFFFLFLLIAIIIDQLVFLGNQDVDTGVKLINDQVAKLQLVLGNIENNAKLLQSYGYDMTDEYNAAKTSCASTHISGYDSEISTYQSSMDSLVSALKPVTKNLNNVHDYIQLYGIFYRNIALYIIWGLAILCCLLILFFFFLKTLTGMKCMLFFTMVTYALYLILGVPWVLVASIGGDLCMAPTANLLKSMPKDSDLRNIASYYATCIGNNTLQHDIDSGTSSLTAMNSSLTMLLTPPYIPTQNCPGNHDIQSLQGTMNYISYAVDGIELDLTCSPIQEIWFAMMNEGFCKNLYTGIFYIWGSQLVTSFFLFLLMVTMSMIYQYFDIVRIAPSGEDGDGKTPADHLGEDVGVEAHHHQEPAEMVKYELVFEDHSEQEKI